MKKSKVFTRFLLCLTLVGCLPAMSLGRLVSLGGRGMLVETSAARMALAGRMVSAAGGAEAFAARAISANIGSAILADARLVGAGTRNIPVTITGGGSRTLGNIAVESTNVARVSLGKSQGLRIVRTQSRSGPSGKIAEHFDRNGRMVSYSRYSPDDLRFDYYAPVGDGGFQPVLYGLRSPRTGDVTLFGPNHRYLGRAIYRMAVSKAARELASQTLEQVSDIQVHLNDAQEYGDFRLCSEMYLLLRQTHFQQEWDKSTPIQFWESMYLDCPNDRPVVVSYQKVMLSDAIAETNRSIKIRKLDEIISKFPDYEDAIRIKERVGI
jgi:hypothetical protein